MYLRQINKFEGGLTKYMSSCTRRVCTWECVQVCITSQNFVTLVIYFYSTEGRIILLYGILNQQCVSAWSLQFGIPVQNFKVTLYSPA